MLCRLSAFFGCCCYISFVENYVCRPTLMCTTYACEQLKKRTKKRQESKKKTPAKRRRKLICLGMALDDQHIFIRLCTCNIRTHWMLCWPASNYWNEQQKQHTFKSRVFVIFRSKLFIFNIFLLFLWVFFFFRKAQEDDEKKGKEKYTFLWFLGEWKTYA